MATHLLQFPKDIREKLRRRWAGQRSNWLAGNGQWPMTFSLGRPTQADAIGRMDGLNQWVCAWQEVEAPGQIQWQEISWHQLGRHKLPLHLLLASPAEVAAWVNEEQSWHQARARHDRLVDRWPMLAQVLPGLFDMLSHYNDPDFERLLTLLDWLEANPASNVYPRQLPIAGIDTKWLESRQRLVAKLFSSIRTDESNSRDFYQCCGLRALPNQMRMLILDPALRQPTGGLRDISAPVNELASLHLKPHCVFIIENIQSGLAFDDLEGAIAIIGLGYGVDVLCDLPWVQAARVFYWGDIDTDGLAILNRGRKYFRNMPSLLMDEDTLLRHRNLCVEEQKPNPAEILENLTQEESDLYQCLKTHRWGYRLRLEQERIPWQEAWKSITQAHAMILERRVQS